MIIKSESKQTTISKKVSLKGVGLHTGLDVEINFLPAEINNGYTFRRIDLEGLPIIKAIIFHMLTAKDCDHEDKRYWNFFLTPWRPIPKKNIPIPMVLML